MRRVESGQGDGIGVAVGDLSALDLGQPHWAAREVEGEREAAMVPIAGEDDARGEANAALATAAAAATAATTAAAAAAAAALLE